MFSSVSRILIRCLIWLPNSANVYVAVHSHSGSKITERTIYAKLKFIQRQIHVNSSVARRGVSLGANQIAPNCILSSAIPKSSRPTHRIHFLPLTFSCYLNSSDHEIICIIRTRCTYNFGCTAMRKLHVKIFCKQTFWGTFIRECMHFN